MTENLIMYIQYYNLYRLYTLNELKKKSLRNKNKKNDKNQNRNNNSNQKMIKKNHNIKHKNEKWVCDEIHLFRKYLCIIKLNRRLK